MGASIGVVIVAHNSLGVLEEAIRCLWSETDKNGRYSVWVVDSGSDDGQEPPLDLLGADRVLLAPNYGFGTSVNLAVRSGLDSDWIVVINPDAQITLRALSDLTNKAESAGISIAAPVLDDTTTGGHYTSYPTPPWRRRRSLPPDECQGMVRVAAVQGSIVAMSSEAYCALGGFDSGFFLYSEEIDLCYRAESMGMKVAFVPSIEARHVGEGSSTGIDPSWRLAERIRGKHRFFKKHYSKIEAAIVTIMDLGGAGKHVLEVISQLRHDPRQGISWPPEIVIGSHD